MALKRIDRARAAGAAGALEQGANGAAASPYAGARAAFATMHGKEGAVAPVLKARLGLEVTVPAGLDTDALGTFTGEIPRVGDMVETAVAKARLGVAAAGSPFGLASEGAYGPHPQIPFINAGIEVMVLVDEERGVVIREELVDDAAVFDHVVLRSGEGFDAFLKRARFPDHALIVRPHEPLGEGVGPLAKGVRDEVTLHKALATAAEASADGFARIEHDMRAHMNPTRMAAIGRLAKKLADRALCACPACGAPGFGFTDVARGLPCGACGAPTERAEAEVFACADPACGHQERRPPRHGLESAEPRWCPYCNP